jgi:hypothetical protein
MHQRVAPKLDFLRPAHPKVHQIEVCHARRKQIATVERWIHSVTTFNTEVNTAVKLQIIEQTWQLRTIASTLLVSAAGR